MAAGLDPSRRVVITGVGSICALGTDVPSMWAAMCEGRSAIGPITGIPLRDLKVTAVAEIAAIPDVIEPKRLQLMDRVSVLATVAAAEAIAHAGLDVAASDSTRVGAVVGIGIAGAATMDENYRAVLVEGKSRAGVFTVPKVMPSAPAAQVSMGFGLRGPVFGVTSACASSNHAFASALDLLRSGRADVVVAGGAEAPIVWGVLKSWEALRILAPDTCRPFSADRKGLVVGEGAAMVVMETLEHARARGATILAEFAGAGLSGDASDMVNPTVDGPASAIRLCLADAGLEPADVDYVSAHGTGTSGNDPIETRAIRNVFGAHADGLSVSSTKSMHAHCFGASGALEMIACVMAIRDGIIPPTANYTTPDPACDLDVTPNVARRRPVRAAISNSFAFGGMNAVIAVKEFAG